MKILGYIIVIKRSGSDGTPYPLTSANPSCAIGRGIECDIRVQLPVVSLQHCRIEVEQSGKAYLTNASASNPTHLNKQKLCPEEIQMLCHGDIIHIADRQLRWEYPEESLLAATTRREKDDYKILTPHAKAPIRYQNDQFNGVGNHISGDTDEQNGIDPRRKKVSFGRDLHPEHFDKKLPPSTPVRKGEKPDNRTDLFVSPLTLGVARKSARASATPSASTIVEENGSETPTKSLLRRRSPTPVKPYLARSLGLLTPKSSPENESSRTEVNCLPSIQPAKSILDNQIGEINPSKKLSDLSPKYNAAVTDWSSPKIIETPTSKTLDNASPKAEVNAKQKTPKKSSSPKVLGSKISRSSTPKAQIASNLNTPKTKKSPGLSRKTSPNSSPKEDTKTTGHLTVSTPKSQKSVSEKSSCRLSPKDSITTPSEDATPKVLRSSSPRTARWIRSQSPVSTGSRDSSPKSPSNASPKTSRDLSPSTPQSPRTPRDSSPKTPVGITPRTLTANTSLNGPKESSPKTSRGSSPNTSRDLSPSTQEKSGNLSRKDSLACNSLDEIPKALRSSSPRTARWIRSQSPVTVSPKTPRDPSPKSLRSSSPTTPKDAGSKRSKSSSPKTPKDENSKTPKATDLKASGPSSPRTPKAADLINSSTSSSSDQMDTSSKTSRTSSPKTPRDMSPANTSEDVNPRILRSSSPRAVRRMRSQSPVSTSPKTPRHSSPKAQEHFSLKTSVDSTPQTLVSWRSECPKNTSPKTSPMKTTICSSPVATKDSSPYDIESFSPKLSKASCPSSSSTKKTKMHVKNTNRRASLALHLGQSPRKSLKPRRSLSSQVVLNISKDAKPKTPKMSTLKTAEKQGIIVATPSSTECTPMKLAVHNLDVSNTDEKGSPSKKFVRSDILQLIGTNRTSPRKLELGKRSTPLRMSSPSKKVKTPKRSSLSTTLEKKSDSPSQRTPKTPTSLDKSKKDSSVKKTDVLPKTPVDKTPKSPEIKVNSPETDMDSERVSSSLLKTTPCRSDMVQLLGKSRASVRQLSLGKRTTQSDSPVLSPSKRTPKPSYGLKRKASMSPESPVRKKIKTGSKTPSTGSKSLSTKKLSVKKQPLGKSTPKKSWADVLKRGLMAHGVPAAKAQQVSIVMNKARIARQNKRPGNERTPPTFSTEIPSNFKFGKSTGHANSPASIFIHKKTAAKTPKLYRKGRKLPMNPGKEKGNIDNIELEGLAELLNTPESKKRNLVQKATGWTLPDIVNHFTPLSKAVRLRQMYAKNKGNETPGARSDVSSISTVTPVRIASSDSVDYSPSQFSPVTPPDGNTSMVTSLSFANTPASHMNYTNFDFSSVKTPDVTEENFVSPLITPDQSNKTPERLLRSSQSKSPLVSPVPLESDATTFDFEDAKTPNVSQDMFVSPMSTKSKRSSPRAQANIPKLMGKTPNSPKVTRQNNSVQSSPYPDETAVSTSPSATDNSDSDNVESSSSTRISYTGHTADYTDVRGMKGDLRTPKADYTDVHGMKRLLKTSKSSVADQEPDYTDVTGMKKLLKTPKSAVESPEVSMTGIRKLLETPRAPLVEHEADYTDVAGVKMLLNTPKLLDSVPEADYTDVVGMKKLLKTPKDKGCDCTDVRGIRNLLKTPKESAAEHEADYSHISGIRKLLRTPKAVPESPKADYTNVAGMKKLLATPRTEVFENEADYTDVAGIKKLLKTPHRTDRERNPVSDYTNIHGLKKLLKTPHRNNEVIADYTDPKGLKKLMATPKQRSSEPLSDYTNVTGVKKLMRTPHGTAKSPQADYTLVDGIRNLMKTPKTTLKHMDIDFEGVSQLMKSPVVNNATVIEQIIDLVKDAATPTSLRKSSRTKKAVSPSSSSPSENVPPEEELKMIVDLIRNEDLKGAISPRRSQRNVKASPMKDNTPKKARGSRKTAHTISTPDVDVESTEKNTPTTRSARGKRIAAEGESSTHQKKIKKGEQSSDAQLEKTEYVNNAADLIVSKEDTVESQALTEKVENPVVEQIATPKRRGRGQKEVKFDIPAPQEVTPVSKTRGRHNQKAKESADVPVASKSKTIKEELANGSESKAGVRRRGRGKKDLETEAEQGLISKEGNSLMNGEGHTTKQTRTRRGKTTHKELPDETDDKLMLESKQESTERVSSMTVEKTDEKEGKPLDQTKRTRESSSSSEERKPAKRGCVEYKEVAVDVQPSRTRRGRGRQVVNNLKESEEVTAEKPSPIVRRGRGRKTNDSEASELVSTSVTKAKSEEEITDASSDNADTKKVKVVAEKPSPAVRRGRARKTKDFTAKYEEEITSASTDNTDTKMEVEETKENKVKASARSRRGQKRQASEEREVAATQSEEDNVEKASSKRTRTGAKAQKSEDKAEKQEVEQPARRTRGKKNDVDTSSSKAEADAKDEDVPVARPRRGNKKETKAVAESIPTSPEKTTRRTRSRK